MLIVHYSQCKMNFVSVYLLLLICVVGPAFGSSIGTKAGGKKMVCYYGSWAVYRPGNGKFDIENIDPFLCTHIIYTFTGLGQDYRIRVLDPWNDLYDNYGKGAFLRFTGLKKQNPSLKALIAVGGWNEGSESYSTMAADPAKRATFVQSAVEFVRKYGFDGLDFDWEYPANRGGVPSDKSNFISLIRELKNALSPYSLLLTAAVSAGKHTIDSAYEVPALASIFDQVHLMAYDLHGAWESFTGLHAPLFANPNYDLGENLWLNTNWSVNYWLSQGVPRSNLILGMPLYGRGWIIANSDNNGFYAAATDGLPAGPYTREKGFWGYNEICEEFKADASWKITRDSCYQSPYAVKGNLWLGYEDQESLTQKGRYIAAMGLGGAMVWSIETDDFRGFCHGTPFLLIRSIVDAINGPTNLMPPNLCNSPTNTTSTTTTPSNIISTTSRTTSSNNTSSNVTPAPVIPTCAPASTPSPNGGGNPEPNLICKKEGLNPDPTDCGTFYQCVAYQSGWLVYKQQCAPGTAFSVELNTCAHPQNVPGCGNYTG